MIKGFCQNGQLEGARELLLKMQQLNLSPDAITYNTIVQGILLSGDYENATKFLEEMSAKGFSPNSFTFSLLLDLVGTKEKNPTLFKMIQKLGPSISKQYL